VVDRDRWRDEERYRRDEDEGSRYGEYADERRDHGRYAPDYGVPGGYGREGSFGEYRGGYGRDYGRREYSPSYGPGRSYGEPSRGYGKEGYGEDRGAYGGERYGGRRSGSRSGREGYGSSGYGRGGGDEERGWWERASDEVSSWFGDQEAERRRAMDYQREGRHRGRGPKGYTRSDDRIREEVCDRLTDDPVVDASDVEVNVSNCEVTLSGTVENREERRRAEDCAERVSGVTHVQNNLRVKQARNQEKQQGGQGGQQGGGQKPGQQQRQPIQKPGWVPKGEEDSGAESAGGGGASSV
jgi:osmotically-inducible protein OsmY